jgi:small subunit ribosomal protein S9
MEKESFFYATGKRKNAIARTWLKPGSGEITINNKTLTDYFPIESLRTSLLQPLILTDNRDSFDINVKIKGGGFSGQTIAVRHGITKALIDADPELRQLLKKAGFIKRDPRVKERKKPGKRGARASYQFSKR